jgi:hypothetical protein
MQARTVSRPAIGSQTSCGPNFDCVELQYARAFIDGEEEGFAAIYTRKGTSQIVGATLVAAHAGEMISELTLAVTSKLTMELLAETVHCYPTQAEVFQRIALDYVQSTKQKSRR